MHELPKSARNELARQQGASAAHPDANLFAAYSEGTATPKERAQIEAHLAVCPECREVVFLASAAGSTQASATSHAKEAKRTRWFPVWVPWAAAAAMMVAAAAMTYRVAVSPSSKTAEMARTEPRREMAAPSKVAPEQGAPPQPEATPGPESPKPGLLTPKNKAEAQEAKDAVAEAGKKESAAANSQAGLTSKPSLQNDITRGPANQSLAPSASNAEANTDTATNRVADSRAGAAASGEAKPSMASNRAAEIASVTPPPPPPPASSSETVEVSAQAAPADAPRGIYAAKARRQPATQWRIATGGQVQMRREGGAWTPAQLPESGYKVVSTIGDTVWVGGTRGALLVSRDEGQSWTPVTLPGLSGSAIVKIRWRDATRGEVADAAGQSWTTTDGGRTWQQH